MEETGKLPYIEGNPEELFDSAPQEIQNMILGDEVNSSTAILGKIYKIPISSYVALENIISFTLIGALQPENVVRALMDILELPREDAEKLAADMEKSILEKARIKILGKSPKDMVTISLQEGRTPDELRKEILDTTKRILSAQKHSSPTSHQNTPQKQMMPKISTATPGSRSQLLEDLQVLDAIPNDEEVSDRLRKIQEQIASIKEKNNTTFESPIPPEKLTLQEGESLVADAEPRPATYSKAPTKYNVDPYREVSES